MSSWSRILCSDPWSFLPYQDFCCITLGRVENVAKGECQNMLICVSYPVFSLLACPPLAEAVLMKVFLILASLVVLDAYIVIFCLHLWWLFFVFSVLDLITIVLPVYTSIAVKILAALPYTCISNRVLFTGEARTAMRRLHRWSVLIVLDWLRGDPYDSGHYSRHYR